MGSYYYIYITYSEDIESITFYFKRSTPVVRTHLIINGGTAQNPGAILRVAGGNILRDD